MHRTALGAHQPGEIGLWDQHKPPITHCCLQPEDMVAGLGDCDAGVNSAGGEIINGTYVGVVQSFWRLNPWTQLEINLNRIVCIEAGVRRVWKLSENCLKRVLL
jgi:hypothetical protein